MPHKRKIKDKEEVRELIKEGFNYAQIGRLLRVSRERIRQIAKELCTVSEK